MIIGISDDDLFYLRAAAAEWLKANHDSLNSADVRRALMNTQENLKEDECKSKTKNS